VNDRDQSDELDGFRRLERTHRRIEEKLDALVAACAELADPERRYASIERILETVSFFARAAVRHHDDEEETLFPRLATIPKLAAIVSVLHAEHHAHDQAFEPIRRIVERWDETGPSAKEEQELPGLAAKLNAIYRRHIAHEERDLFPAARTALPASAAEEMGREMRARRGK
jgi:hemerythrin-like domain-containing protein